MKCDEGCLYWGHCHTDEDCTEYRPECGCNKSPETTQADVALNDVLGGIIDNLEYAAFNLCEKSDDDVEQGVIESTCPETTLFLAIRQLKQLAT